MTDGLRVGNMPLRTSQPAYLFGLEIIGGQSSARRVPLTDITDALAIVGYVIPLPNTLAGLNADLDHDSGTMAIVRGDSTGSNNGYYRKSGVSGSGSWTRVMDLPDEIVELSVGGGTANAIQATAYPQNPSNASGRFFILVPASINTGATTLAVDDDAALPIVNAFTGAPLIGGELPANSPAMLRRDDDAGVFQLFLSTNFDASAVAAAVAADRVAAQAAAADAAANGSSLYPSITALVAATVNTSAQFFETAGRAAAGDLGASLLKKVTSGQDFTTANSVKLKVIPKSPDASLLLNSFVAADGSQDAVAAVNTLVQRCAEYGIKKINCPGTFAFETVPPDPFDFGVVFEGHGDRHHNFIRKFSQANANSDAAFADPFLHWRGSNPATDAAKGGGVRNLMVYSGGGTVGGVAMKFEALDVTERGGYEYLQNCSITGDGEFGWGLVVDGSVIDDIPSGGFRDPGFINVKVFRCRYSHASFRGCRHITVNGFNISDGGLGVTPVLTLAGGATPGTRNSDLQFSGLQLAGNIAIANTDNSTFSGSASASNTSGNTECIWNGPMTTIPNQDVGITFVLPSRIVRPSDKEGITGGIRWEYSMDGKYLRQWGVATGIGPSATSIALPKTFGSAGTVPRVSLLDSSATNKYAQISGRTASTLGVFVVNGASEAVAFDIDGLA